MSMRFGAASLAAILAAALPAVANGQEPPEANQDRSKSGAATSRSGATRTEAPGRDAKPEAKLEKATFGGGCFWCLEAVFERMGGVKNVVSGYAGGTVANPNYEMVRTGLTGHAEVVQITYDPTVVSYEKLLNIFWKCHDPTTLNQQGPDFGTQYRSIILYHDKAQKEAAEKSYEELMAARAFARPIVTELVPLTIFYRAEAYHQDYYRKHPGAAYCQIYIAPKLRKLGKTKGK
jgi:peptide-methionine (S)-S-oxide reductase